MPHPAIPCCACGRNAPIGPLATLAGGRQLALCRACGADPARVRAFVAHFDAARLMPERPGTARPVGGR